MLKKTYTYWIGLFLSLFSSHLLAVNNSFSIPSQPLVASTDFLNVQDDEDNDSFLLEQIAYYQGLIDEIVNVEDYRIYIDGADYLSKEKFLNIGFAYHIGNFDIGLALKTADYTEDSIDISRQEIVLAYNNFIAYLKGKSSGMYFGFDLSYAELELENKYDEMDMTAVTYSAYFGYRYKMFSWLAFNMSIGPKFQIMPKVRLVDEEGGSKTILTPNTLEPVIADINFRFSFEF